MVKNQPANVGDKLWSLGWEDPLEEEKETHSSILAWKNPRARGAGQATGHRVAKSQTRLSMYAKSCSTKCTFLGQEMCMVVWMQLIHVDSNSLYFRLVSWWFYSIFLNTGPIFPSSQWRIWNPHSTSHLFVGISSISSGFGFFSIKYIKKNIQ